MSGAIRRSAVCLGKAKPWRLQIDEANRVSREALEEARYRLFDTIPSGTVRTGYKFLRKKKLGPRIANYYFERIKQRHANQFTDGFRDPQWVYRQFKLAELHRRGKGPPKKGEGRRKK